MERKKASDFHPEVLRLFDGYVHGAISRRDFLQVGTLGAVGFALPDLLAARQAQAAADGKKD